jgi:hypothetical protein
MLLAGLIPGEGIVDFAQEARTRSETKVSGAATADWTALSRRREGPES